MQLNCKHCDRPFQVDDNLAGQTVRCPHCMEELTVETPLDAGPLSPHSPIDPSVLRDAKESFAFGCLVVLSFIPWLLIIIWIIGSMGALLVIIGLGVLAKLFAELFAAAYIKTNAVEVSGQQFPEIHGMVTRFAERIGKTPPAVYVMQENVWNSVAMKLAGRRIVVLLSGALDSLLLNGDMDEVAWLVGHELGHHFAGHLDFWRRTTAGLGAWFFWIYMWYCRRCELTCDRYGLACAGSLDASLRAVCNMAVGSQLANTVNIKEAILQWQKHREEFFVRYRTMYSTHPHTLWRLEELVRAARDLGMVEQAPEPA